MIPWSSSQPQETNRGAAPILGGCCGESFAGVEGIDAQPSRALELVRSTLATIPIFALMSLELQTETFLAIEKICVDSYGKVREMPMASTV
jgi:hypothetical protein